MYQDYQEFRSKVVTLTLHVLKILVVANRILMKSLQILHIVSRDYAVSQC